VDCQIFLHPDNWKDGTRTHAHWLTASRSASELHSKKEFCFFFYSEKKFQTLYFIMTDYIKNVNIFFKNYNLI
jgi:hypothetical protein